LPKHNKNALNLRKDGIMLAIASLASLVVINTLWFVVLAPALLIETSPLTTGITLIISLLEAAMLISLGLGIYLIAKSKIG
jgi:hypothetical protein